MRFESLEFRHLPAKRVCLPA